MPWNILMAIVVMVMLPGSIVLYLHAWKTKEKHTPILAFIGLCIALQFLSNLFENPAIASSNYVMIPLLILGVATIIYSIVIDHFKNKDGNPPK